MTMVLEIYRGEEHLISGELVYVHADTAQGKSMPVPAAWRERLMAFERTAPAQ
jgi:acyl-CoA thioester hydrolase